MMDSKWMIVTVLLALLLSLSGVCAQDCSAQPKAKQRAGSPDEFGATTAPPATHLFSQQSSVNRILSDVELGGDGLAWISGVLPIDSPSLARLTLISPYKGNLRVEVEHDDGERIELPDPVMELWPLGDSTPGPDGNLFTYTFTFEDPKPGRWTVRTRPEEKELKLDKVVALLFNDNPNLLLGSSSSAARGLTLGDTWDVRSYLDPEADDLKAGGMIHKGQVTVYLPDKSTKTYTLKDLGTIPTTKHEQAWGTSFVVSMPGVYIANITVEGVTGKGVPFARSQNVVATVQEASTQLTGESSVRWEVKKQRFIFNLDVTEDTPEKLSAYAQVYGTSTAPEGGVVPVAWIGSMVYVQQGPPGQFFVQLELDGDWLAAASASSPFTLHNVSLTTADEDVMVSYKPSMNVQEGPGVAASVQVALDKRRGDPRFFTSLPSCSWYTTEEMRKGLRPASMNSTLQSGETTLMFVHGYCSDSNPFERYYGTQCQKPCLFFLDANANRGNDEFAVLLYQFACESGVSDNDKLSMVGHSQGGMAIAHLKEHYWSGLDVVSSRKVLQSLGTPYLGSSIAGNTAQLGAIFGVGCGAQQDLTLSGAPQWGSSISTETRAMISFYYTTYEEGKLFGDYCNLGANALLEWPNDGTTEEEYALFSGANNMGKTEKQCHVDDMKHPAQYSDNARNSEMDQYSR